MDNAGTRTRGSSWTSRLASNESFQEWLLHSCPLKSFRYWDCYKTRKIERASLIDKREWVPTDINCRPFWPYDFLRTVENKAILFIGDSVMIQVYITMVCELFQSTQTKFNIEWSSEPHVGHFVNSDVHFPVTNTTISFRLKWRYYQNDLQKILSSISEKVSVIVINFGLWYNLYPRKPAYQHDPGDYEVALHILSSDLALFLQSRSADNNSKILVLETLPQHFAGSNSNGFYNIDAANIGCQPIMNISDDWRLSTMHSVIFPEAVKIVNISQALYSQWDSHMDGDVVPQVASIDADCTHWCLDSGALRFVRLMLWNALISI